MDGCLANYHLCLLVSPQAMKHRVADMATSGPFCKSDLRNQRRLDPMNVAANTAGFGKGIVGSFDFLQLRLQIAQRRIAESRADIACVSQFFFLIVKAQ
jgi:hypothetical protein